VNEHAPETVSRCIAAFYLNLAEMSSIMACVTVWLILGAFRVGLRRFFEWKKE